jgi:hypothetical protein
MLIHKPQCEEIFRDYRTLSDLVKPQDRAV